MKKIFLAVGYQSSVGYSVLGYYATRALAREVCERIVAESPITKQHEAGLKRGVAANWQPWDYEGDPPQGASRTIGGRTLARWTARSVGGMNGNPWSFLVVVEAEIEGSAVDRLAEVAR